MKPFPAILAALLITAVIGVSMFAIGGNALLNKNNVPMLNSPAGVTDVSAASTSSTAPLPTDLTQQQMAQMQQLISQYQDREKQYQDQLSQAATQLNQANQQLAQANQDLQVYQQVLTALQQRGIIRITSDGQILLPRGLGGGDNN